MLSRTTTFKLIAAGMLQLGFPTISSAYLNECGQPTGIGEFPTTSAAQYVLKAAVGTVACSPCLCSVDNNGTITTSDALKVLQKAVGQNVTLTCPNTDSDQCVECSTDPADAVDNATQIFNAVNTANNPNIAHMVIFRCSGTVPISAMRNDALASEDLPGVAYWKDPEVRDADMVIDGTGLDNQPITFVLTPSCDEVCFGYCSEKPSQRCSGFDQCETDGPCCNDANGSGSCFDDVPVPSGGDGYVTSTEVLAGPILRTASLCQGTKNDLYSSVSPTVDEDGDGTLTDEMPFRAYPEKGGRRFLKIFADNVIVRDMKLTGFGNGIEFAKKNGTVENVTFERICDDAVSTTRGSGMGAIVKNSTFNQGFENCVHVRKGANTNYLPANPLCAIPADSTGTPPNRECYHLSIFDSSFNGCFTPLKVTPDANNALAGDDAKLYVSNTTATELSGLTNTSTSAFACGGSILAGLRTIAAIVDYKSTGCERGLTLGGLNSTFRVKGNPSSISSYIRSSEIAGILVETTGSGKPILRSTQIFENGGHKAFDGLSGGVALNTNADVDAGLDNGTGSTNGTPNKGGNKINCNLQKPSTSSSNADVYNASTKLNVKFRGNNWGDDTNFAVDVNGSTTQVDQTISDPFSGASNLCTLR